MDLVSVTIIHHFTSPSWLKAVQKHLDIGKDESKESGQVFKRIQRLRAGEALVFAPSAILVGNTGKKRHIPRAGSWGWTGDECESDNANQTREPPSMKRMGGETFRIKIRERITDDAGETIAVCG